MKFPAEKKSTLCIYTEATPTDKLAGISAAGPAPGAEAMNGASAGAGAAEAAALRKELEGARSALRRQEARCRLLVAALGARLREREEAARAERLLRDRQLAGVLRALTALEARLRQEQRLIRRQLVERDATISAQAEELRRLRSAHGEAEESEQPERFRWPGEEGGSAGDDAPVPPRPSFALHRSARSKAHGVAAPVPSSAAAAAAAAAARRESEATLLRFRPTLNGSAGATAAAELDCSALDSDSGVFHGSDGSDSSLRSDEATASGGGCCADEEPDDDLPAPARDLAKHYAHNPVLECVSQILLRDRDEAGSPPAQAQPPPPHGPASATGRRRAPPPPALWPSIREERESLADDADDADAEEAPSPPPPPAPPARAQHLQERACALLTRRLTVVSHPELEQVDGAAQLPLEGSPPPPSPPPPAAHHVHVHAHAHAHAHAHGHAHAPSHKAPGAPPAVPPKPPQLGALGRLRRRAPARSQASAAATNGANVATATPGPRPHRQILSNGSLLKAAAERGGGAGVSVAAVAAPAPVGARARGVGPVATRVQRQLESRPAAIRVGSSVSSLITGAAGGSIVNELARDRHPDALHSHFEEFRLEDVDISEAEDRERERERASGDGAAPLPVPAPAPMGPAAQPPPPPSVPTAVPAPAPPPNAAAVVVVVPAPARGDATTYESFLEATGLSQKPLLTPSRMLSNHRSVLKPKDVKLRSRAARAAAGAPAAPPDRPAPVVRYWVEPFL